MIVRLADAAFEPHASPLLHDMSGFVRRGTKARRARERNLITNCVRRRVHLVGGCLRGAAHVSADM